MSPDRLACHNLHKAFGALEVTRDVSLRLPAGSRTALIGPNGAGKTTLVNLLSGALAPSGGQVLLEGQDVTTSSAPSRARAGLVRTFQISRLFREATVRDNLRTAVLHRLGWSAKIWLTRSMREQLDAESEEALAALQITHMADRVSGQMAIGEQRLVEIALALAMKPRVLLLDEPAAGVPESESGRILDAIQALPADLAVLLIEHDMDLVFRFARHIVVLVQGALFAQGTPREVAANDDVKQVYFGKGAHERRQ
jgi:branched-chain amino acid transport system ATP-binding protein